MESGAIQSSKSIKSRLVTYLLLIGLIPLLIVSVVALMSASSSIEDSSYKKLEAVREIKRKQVSDYYTAKQADLNVLVETAGTLRQEAMSKLMAVRDNKKNSIELYFNTIKDQVLTLSSNRMIIDAAQGFRSAFYKLDQENAERDQAAMDSKLKTYYEKNFSEEFNSQNGRLPASLNEKFSGLSDVARFFQYLYIADNEHPLGGKDNLDALKSTGRGSAYDKWHRLVHPVIRDYLNRFGYYDIFLVDSKTGHIVYSVFKELDFGTSLKTGPFAQTNFGEAFRQASVMTTPGDFVFVDYAQYWPSYQAPASFIAAPVIEYGTNVGVLIFQMPLDRVTKVMSERSGLGKTGETYLVGPDNLMRSDSYLDSENRTVTASFRNPEKGRIDTEASRAALAGATGEVVANNYNGNPILSAYTPVDVLGIRWALLSEIDVAEAFVPKIRGKENDYYQDYVAGYNFYDLFLINPNGHIFYSVAKEADYNTNLFTGPYKDSNLADAVRRAKESGKFQFADFKPYAPSNNEPASFVVQPFLTGANVELLVALQIPLEPIANIMAERSGMGETGETYLVGPDKLMRSNSFIDSSKFSVNASFKNPSAGSVNTVASKGALAGDTGTQVITNHHNKEVLSAFAPIEIFGQRWATIAEMTTEEAFAASSTLRNIMMLMAIIVFALIVFIALRLADGIVKPILALVNTMTTVKRTGSFSERIEVHSNDEIGQAGAAFNQLMDNLQLAIDRANSVLSAIARGDFDKRINDNFQGELDSLKRGVNGTAASVNVMMSALGGVMEGMKNGEFATRMSSQVEGEFKAKVDGAMQSTEDALSEINRVTEALGKGDFSQRIETPLNGDLDKLKQNVNRSLDSLDSAITNITMVSQAQKEGDFSQRVDGKYQGQLLELKNSFNGSVESISQAIEELSLVMKGLKQGEFNQRIEGRYFGDLKILGENVNNSLESLNSAIAEIVKVASALEQGDLSVRIEGHYSGELSSLKNALNNSMNATDSVIEEVSSAMRAMRKGDFKQRINANFSGCFHDLATTINSTIENLDHAMEGIGGVAYALSVGDFSKEMEGNFEGQVKSLQDALNSSMISLRSAFTEISQVISDVRNGDFSSRINVTLDGELEVLRDNINVSVTDIEKAMTEITAVAMAQQKGDLTRKAMGSYQGKLEQLKEAINSSSNNLREMITQVNGTAQQVRTSANELMTANSSLSRSTEDQAHALEKIAASMEEMASSVKHSTDNSVKASGYVTDVNNKAKASSSVSDKMIASMKEIRSSSEEIANIIGVIDDIAFQTNLLALNAAVEAARAGEQGRGFAVVASEVRTLAQRSADAAKDIKSLILDSAEKVDEGNEYVAASSEALQEIIKAMEQANAMTSQISNAAQEQFGGIQEVNSAVTRMDEMKQHNINMVQNSANSSNNLVGQAAKLAELVAEFKIK